MTCDACGCSGPACTPHCPSCPARCAACRRLVKLYVVESDETVVCLECGEERGACYRGVVERTYLDWVLTGHPVEHEQ